MSSLPNASFPRTPGLLGPIFEESGRGDRAMREALFLTFNVDLGFFEERILGAVRSSGAAVTVIADGTVFNPDPRAVHSAGRTYTLGLAHHAGAFHPKLTVLAGAERALIGIGSGNLTIGGWHANDEVLTTIRASRTDGVPIIVREIVDFLRRLPEVITISDLAVDGITRTVTELDRLIAGSEPVETGHRLVHSLVAPILNQLPEADAEQLELTAPFHDEHGRALSALVDRYRPTTITVLAQPGRAVMQPKALQHAAGIAHLRFTQLAAEPAETTAYRHGKILTALNTDGRPMWSLTGSPNLTAAALLRSASDPTRPGNCELGILAPSHGSLLPAPTVEVADVPALEHLIPPSTAAADGANSMTTALSEARLTPDGLLVVLSRPANNDVHLQVSHYHAPPEQFTTLGTIPAGQDRTVFAGTFEPGTRIRAGLSLIFVADPDQVQHRLRPATGGGANSNATRADLFSSLAMALQWEKTLTDLVLSHQQPTANRGTVAAKTGDQHQPISWKTLEDDSDWNNYLGNPQNALGLPMFLFAAGPTATTGPVGAALPNAAPAWDDRFDDTPDTFEEEQTAEDLGPDPGAGPTPSGPTPLTPTQRQYYRHWLARLADLVGVLGPIEAIAAAQLVILGAGAQCWDRETGPNGWFDTVHAALRHLVRDDWPERLAGQAASILAIGLYRLRLVTPPDGRGREAQMLHGLATAATNLLSHTSDELLEANLVLLTGAQVVPPTASDIIDEVLDLTTDAPDDALLTRLARAVPDLDAAWTGPRQLLVRGATSNPVQTAARVLDLAEDFDTLAVMVENHRGQWALLALADHRLTIVNGKQTVTYTTHALSNLVTPLSLVGDSERLQRTRISRPPFNTPGDEELDVLDHAQTDALPLPDAVRAKIAK